MVSETARQTVRALYGFRCGYCGVTEAECGSQLEIDHFCPLAHGGTDVPANLVYACPTCNRLKADYWPASGAGPGLMLLHPLRDDVSDHLTSLPDGRLVGLSKRGWFHIQRLRLNRAPLIELRLQREKVRRLERVLEHNRQAQSRLQEYVRELEQEIERLLRIIAELAHP